jgi:hypothetical protein
MTNVFDNSDFDEGFSAKIEKVDAVYKLSWTDNVANDWEEYYPTVASANARLALLLKSSENESLFSTTAEEFAKNFEKLASENLTK